MATPKSQRIGIWIIAAVMAVGSVGAYFVVILANKNDTVSQQTQLEDYAEQMRLAQEAREKSSKPLDGFSAAAFDAASVTELVTEDIKVGEGEEVKATSTIEANYFGWTADGKIFDSTNQDGTVTPATFSLSGVIVGWTEGLEGARVGGIRKLVIPTDMAYDSDAAEQFRPEGPLTFIVEIKSITAAQ